MWIIFAIQAFTILLSLYQTITNTEKIRRMAKFTCPVELRKGDKFVTLGSEKLLPGDVIKVPENVLFPCDFVLLSGSVIVNEAILTGESIPVMKSNMPNTDQQVYFQETCSKHTLFGGTFSLQNRPSGEEPCVAVVTSTGFQTTKGALVRDILYPKELKFRFEADAMKFVFGMGFVAILGYLGCLKKMVELEYTDLGFVSNLFSCIVIAVPPGLPAAASCGLLFALDRLKKLQIFCISPPRVNSAGRITRFVFDKTGTITEEGLTVFGLRIVASNG